MIELLTVICIITVLISILLPAVNKARKSAWSIVCCNNMKQITLAFNSYASDYNDWTPMVERPGNYNNLTKYSGLWVDDLMPYLSAGKRWNGTTAGTPGSLVCPAEKNECYAFSTIQEKTTNYTMNMHLGHAAYITIENYKPKKLLKCKMPSKAAILIDGKAKTKNRLDFEIAGQPSALVYAAQRHANGKDNTSFADGHVNSSRIPFFSESEIFLSYGFRTSSWALIWPE